MGACMSEQSPPPNNDDQQAIIPPDHGELPVISQRLKTMYLVSGYIRELAIPDMPSCIDQLCIKFYNRSLDVQDFELLRTMANVASGRIVEARDKFDAEYKVAVKILPKDKPTNKTLYKHERDILCHVEHQHIVHLIGNSQDESNYYIFTELYAGDELFDRIVSPEWDITEKVAARWMQDMLSAINYLHDKNIVHRDLKPENFVFQNGRIEANILLVNFEKARVVEPDQEYTDFAGTVYYAAPELLSGEFSIAGEQLKCTDLWSLGVIAYVMMAGRAPFTGRSNKDICKNILTKELQFPSDLDLSEEFQDFVTRLLMKDPSERMTVEEAMSHPWIDETQKVMSEEVTRFICYWRQMGSQSEFKKAVARFMAQNMSYEDEKVVRQHFQSMDKDRDGFLRAADLRSLLDNIDIGVLSRKTAEEPKMMLIAAEENGIGSVDFDGFKVMWHAMRLSEEMEYRGRVYVLLDDNGDGYVDATELQGVLGEAFSMEQCAEMIEEVNEVGDGRVSYKEFVKAMKKQREESPEWMDYK